MNDGPFVDEAGKNARRIFYPSLTNSGNLLNMWYSYGYSCYNLGYIESLYLRILVFIIGTKLSFQSQYKNLLCKISKIVGEYNFGFRSVIRPVFDTSALPLNPARSERQAVLWNIVTKS
jgi:hypothetical protein